MFIFANSFDCLDWKSRMLETIRRYLTTRDTTRFVEKPRLNSLLTRDSQRAHSRSMVTLSIRIPLRSCQNLEVALVQIPHTSKRQNEIQETAQRTGEVSIERGVDLGLRSDRGADSVPYYGNRRFSASKGLGAEKRRLRERPGEKREYWRCAAFKYCIQVTFRDRILVLSPLRPLRALFSTPSISRDRTSYNYPTRFPRRQGKKQRDSKGRRDKDGTGKKNLRRLPSTGVEG